MRPRRPATFPLHRSSFINNSGNRRGRYRGSLRRTDLLLAVALVPIGVSCFAIYLWFHSGDALAFQHIQRAWGRAFTNPFWNLWLTIELQFKNGNFRTVSTDLAFGLAAIFGMAMSVVMAWKGKWDWAIFSLFGVLLPLSTNAYSMLRFVVGLAPVLIMSAFVFSRWKWLFYVLLPVLLILDVFLLPVWTSRSYYLM